MGTTSSALVARGKIKDAIAAVTRSITRRPRDSLLYRERAHLHLVSGDALRARVDFDLTAHLEQTQMRAQVGDMHADSEWNAVGLTYWMEGHRKLALSFWRYTTSMLLQNRVSYSHAGGGIESGLLLWFGAVH